MGRRRWGSSPVETVAAKLRRAFSAENTANHNFSFVDSSTVEWQQMVQAWSWIYEGKSYGHLVSEMPPWAYHKRGNGSQNNPVSVEIEGRAFNFRFVFTSKGWIDPMHESGLKWSRDKEIVAQTCSHLPGWDQIVDTIENQVPIRLEMHQLIKEAYVCLDELDNRCSDQEMMQLFAAIPNVIGDDRAATRTRGISPKRKKDILEGKLDVTQNPPVKGDPVPHLESFAHILAHITLKKSLNPEG